MKHKHTIIHDNRTMCKIKLIISYHHHHYNGYSHLWRLRKKNHFTQSFFCQFFSLSWPILHFLITPGWFVIVWPFLSLGWFSLWRDRRQIREKGGGRLIARRCWLSPSTRTAAAVVGRKDGTDPRSADSNTAVNPILRIFVKTFFMIEF